MATRCDDLRMRNETKLVGIMFGGCVAVFAIFEIAVHMLSANKADSTGVREREIRQHAAERPEPKFIPSSGDANWWCSDAMTGDVTCDRLRESCDQRRQKTELVRYLDAPCIGAAAVACFDARRTLTGETQTTCFSSITDCENARDRFMSTNGRDWNPGIDCEKR